MPRLIGLALVGLLSFVIAACCCDFVEPVRAAAPEKQAAAEQAAVQALRPIASNLQFNKDGTARLVRLSRPGVNDQSLALLSPLTQLDYVAVVAPQVGDAGLRHLAGLQRLDTLVLTRCGVTSAGMQHLAGLENLQRLYLADTRVDDAGLAALAGLTNLEVLALERTAIGDDGLQHLAALPRLDTLNLNATAVGDAGLAHLSKLPKLRALYLMQTPVAGSGLSHLAPLTTLEYLNLSGAPLGDDAIAALSQLTQLRTLIAYDTRLTAAGVAQLRERLPKTQIFVSPDIEPAPGWDPLPAAEKGFVANGTQLPKDASEAASDASSQSGPSLALLKAAAQRYAAAAGEVDELPEPDFQRHVIPLLGRLGCNGRNCHGSFQGRGGFRLSMFGYDFAADRLALAGGDQPRVDLNSPDDSLILQKPISEDEHGGGRRFEAGGWEYRLLRRWISAGAPDQPPQAAPFVRLEVTPERIVFQKPCETVQLQCVAVWADGTREDVGCLTRFQSNDDAVAEVSPTGLVTAKGPGDTYIISFYDNGISSTETLLPVGPRAGEKYPATADSSPIDRHVASKLSTLGILPSDTCRDDEFLRRVSLDVTGTLPTPQEVREFLADASPDKRERKIDELLERPAYVAWWTTRLCDQTGSNAGYLGGTEMAQPVAKQWRDWIERRVRDNVGYHEIVADMVLARSRPAGQVYEQFAAAQSEFTRSASPADYAAPGNVMPHFWFRSNIALPKDKALAFGYTFLGVRLDCAECHKHPYDQWSQRDFEQFTEFFRPLQAGVAPDAAESHKQLQWMLGVPVKLDTASLRRQEYLRVAAEGYPIPWSEVYAAPSPPGRRARLLGAGEVELSQYDDPRRPLLEWLLQPDNPYFARSFVNRVWANYFHAGVIHPTDDLNQANPPSNKPLLNYLTQGFIESGYDMKWLHREIARSRTYQSSWRPNETNLCDERNFSRAVIRRLPAEAVVDAILQATAGKAQLAKLQSEMAPRKIAQHPLSFQSRAIDYSLLVFGKPLRTTNCDCERQAQPTLLQALYVRNDVELLAAMERPGGWLAETAARLGQSLVSESTAPATNAAGEKDSAAQDNSTIDTAIIDELIEEAYLRTLSRLPTGDERTLGRGHLQQAESAVEGLRDLLWALLNTQEFVTNH